MRVAQTVDSGLCTGCGMCAVVCPKGAVKVLMNPAKGIFMPTQTDASCCQCDACLRVCPGAEVDFSKLEDKFFRGYKDPFIGVYDSCYFGHACNYDIRFASASGGLVTAILIHALQTHMIDGALVTRMSHDNPLEPESFIAETPDQVIEASGSKYCHTSIGVMVKAIRDRQGKFAVVGLPCQIQGLRKLQDFDNCFRDKIIVTLGLFCANNNTMFAAAYYLKANKISIKDVESITYRSGGWPGKISVVLHDGTEREFKRTTTETSWHRRLLFSSAFHYDFIVRRCLLCSDLTSELADISFGDPWNKQFLGKETVGKSMIIARSRVGKSLLEEVKRYNHIELSEIDPETVMGSQSLRFKFSSGTRIMLRKSLGLPYPKYEGKRAVLSFSGLAFLGDYVMSYLTNFHWSWKLLKPVRYLRFIKNQCIRIIVFLFNRLLSKFIKMGAI